MKDAKNNFLQQFIKTQAVLSDAHFNLDKFMELVVEKMDELTPATGVVVELAEGKNMVYRAASGSVADHVGLHLKKANSISGLCVSKNEILVSNDTEKDSRVNVEACRRVGARSLVVAPLLHKGKALGVLKILSNKAKAFSELDLQTLQIMAGFIAVGLAHQIYYKKNNLLLREKTKALSKLKAAQEKLKYMAHFDPLTQLPNRNAFYEQLPLIMSKINRTRQLMALLYMDLDFFKAVNDTYGHGMGDALLTSFSGRLKKSIRDYDLAARLGGDEFAVILEDVHDQATAIKIVRKIIKIVNNPFKIDNVQLKIGVTIGLAFYEGNKTITADELIKQADTALYIAKESGRNNYHVAKDKPNTKRKK